MVENKPEKKEKRFSLGGAEEFALYKSLNLFEREKEFKQFIYALLTREHLLLNGPAGTGKSLFARNAFALIDGNTSLFSIHMTKFMSEELLFGPIDIKKLREKSVIEYNTKGSALDATFLYLDEFFDASDPLLRSLLEVLNEREWRRGQQYKKCPLHTAIVTSNYKRENEITEAVLDRFIFKADVKPIKAVKSRKEMFCTDNVLPKPAIDFAMLEEACKIIDSNQIIIPTKISDVYDLLHKEFKKNTKKYVSDRTLKKAIKVIRASAYINNREEATIHDLKEVKYVFCTLNNATEEGMFDAAFDKLIEKDEAEKEITISLEKITEVIDQFPADMSTMSEKDFLDRMKELNEHLGLLSNIAPPTDALKDKKKQLSERVKKLLFENREKFIVNR
mgnify:CR=1 FL=1